MPSKFNEWTPGRKERFLQLREILRAGQEIPSPAESQEEENSSEHNYICLTCGEYFDSPRGSKCPHCGRNNSFDSIR